MYCALLRFDLQPAHREDFIAAVVPYAQDVVRDELGTLRFDVIQDLTDSNRFYVSEMYTDKAAVDTHVAGEHFQRIWPLVSPWLAAPMQVLGQGVRISPPEGTL